MSPKFFVFSVVAIITAGCGIKFHRVESETGLRPVTNSDFHFSGSPDAKRVHLGNFLFFDKVVSGNRNISCATCHHPSLFSVDGLSLPVGEGGKGRGPQRIAIDYSTSPPTELIRERMPRNAPALFNLGAKEFNTFFHDGRLKPDNRFVSGFINPAADKHLFTDELPTGFDFALEAQNIFPLTNPTEMAGHAGENSQADFAAINNFTGIWSVVVEKLRNNPEYVNLFKDTYGLQSADEIKIVHVGKSLAAFISVSFRADQSPFDSYLRGNTNALNDRAKQGMSLFYGKANCVSCHSGPFQTDHKLHSIAMPQIGPGPGDDGEIGLELEDFGLERVTENEEDRYKFRTPSLRNVELSGPWGHAGAFSTLEAVVRHHLNPASSLNSYTLAQAILPSAPNIDPIDGLVMASLDIKAALLQSSTISPVALTSDEIQSLIEFLKALTDPNTRNFEHLIPDRVPSGLPLTD